MVGKINAKEPQAARTNANGFLEKNVLPENRVLTLDEILRSKYKEGMERKQSEFRGMVQESIWAYLQSHSVLLAHKLVSALSHYIHLQSPSGAYRYCLHGSVMGNMSLENAVKLVIDSNYPHFSGWRVKVLREPIDIPGHKKQRVWCQTTLVFYKDIHELKAFIGLRLRIKDPYYSIPSRLRSPPTLNCTLMLEPELLK